MVRIGFDGISFAYGKSNLLFKDLTLQLGLPADSRHGHVVAILGPSGTGKTTLLRLVCKVELPLRGSLAISPKDANVSYLQQQPVLFEHLSRLENARYFESIHRTKKQFDEIIFEKLVTKLKLSTVLASSGGIDQLSGGERQRLSLLRALSIRPKILLLDEPCTGLDTDVKLEFLHMLREVVDELGLLTLYVTHHGDEAELIADDLLYLARERDTSPVDVTLLPIAEALDSPPSPEAALGSIGPAANIISCTVGDSGVILTPAKIVLGRIVGRTIDPGNYIAVFAPKCVKWSFGTDGEVVKCGQSALYTFAATPEIDRLFGPSSKQFEPKSFSIEGEITIFKESGGKGMRVITAQS
jgi:ABC-type nitrate/sulfonate/bicarbonate transport system ATPase subunit